MSGDDEGGWLSEASDTLGDAYLAQEALMDGSIPRITLSDGFTRDRARYRDPGGRQHERRFARKVDAQRWLDQATSGLVEQTWTAPVRGRITGHASAAMTLDVYSGLFDDDLTALADRMDAAAKAAADARVGAVRARPSTKKPSTGKRSGRRGGPRGDRTHNPRIKSPSPGVPDGAT